MHFIIILKPIEAEREYTSENERLGVIERVYMSVTTKEKAHVRGRVCECGSEKGERGGDGQRHYIYYGKKQ
jgi:hypothetical protein